MRHLLPSLVLGMSVSIASGADIHVSPHGSNKNQATAAAPVRSLEKARDLARAARRANPNNTVRILLHPGIYIVPKTVCFTKPDSGTEAAPLVIQAWKDPKRPAEWPKLIGGVMVSGWKKSSFRNKGLSATRAQVYEADLKRLGINKKLQQLYLQGARQIWARYPNYDPSLPYSGGWAYVDGKSIPVYRNIHDERTDTIVVRETDRRNWSRPTDGEVCVFPRYNWLNHLEQIKQFDPATGVIAFQKEMRWAARPGNRYAVFGMKEELDSPGEWYQDVEGQKLYFLPPRVGNGSTVTIPTADVILSFRNAANIIIRGLEFTCAERTAVMLSNCERVVVEKSLVHDMGYFSGAGIVIQGGSRCAVRGCDLWNLGATGVAISAGNAVKMEKSLHVVDNCYIHHVGQINRFGFGLSLSEKCCGVTLSHNLIHDTPRYGINCYGVFHTVEYNRVRHCNTETEDAGCIYGFGWTTGWTVIRHNHCTDSIGFNQDGQFYDHVWGIYLDECTCGFEVYGNIVERCQSGAMHFHNSRENHVYNNIFSENGCSDPNPKRYGTMCQICLNGWDNNPNGYFLKTRAPMMEKAYNEIIDNPKWKTMPGMAVPPKETILPDGTMMQGNRLERNIFYYPRQPKSFYARVRNCNLKSNIVNHNILWNGGKEPIHIDRKHRTKARTDLAASKWDAWQQDGADTHSIVADPMFVDAEHGNFRLKPQSPALKHGFKQIPLDRIGPYKDDARASWPIKEAEGVREHPEWLKSIPIDN